MTDENVMIDVMDARVKRREERRDLFRMLGGKAVAGGTAAMAAASAAQAQAAPSDNDILNFALNLEYLEAQFYSFAAFGQGLAAADLNGTTGTRGDVVAGNQRQVPFSDAVVRQYAREIAADEVAHVRFLRTALGSAAVAQPTVDIRGGANTPFGNAAAAAGLAADFDPYADDNSFLLGAYIFEDVGVTAYKGAAPLISNKGTLEAAAGILAVEAYHAGLIRTVLYGKGVQTPVLRTAADRISDARDSLDGETDLDQGISPMAPMAGSPRAQSTLASNIVPLDANGLAFSRSGAQVLNIVFLNPRSVTAGGFFPAGVNGPIRTSGGTAA